MKKILLGTLLLAAGCLSAQAQTAAPQVSIEADLTVRVENARIPPSNILSEESKAILHRARPTEGPGAAPQPKVEDMAELRRRMNLTLAPNVAHMRELHPVDVEESMIDGISVAIITPKGGVPEANKNRIMINAPGGGFRTGIRANGLLISIPVSAVGKFKVISLLYRQGPEYKFPAATEDFTKVYKAVLKDYKPANIGFVGCSAGGSLVTQTVAAALKAGLPIPGAMGVYCAGLSAKWMEGDSAVFTGMTMVAPMAQQAGPSYLDSVDVNDPAVSPANDLKVLARFPPTLFATATRDFAMSSAAYGHRRLLRAGVESDLLIYDGLGHGFMTNPDYPESQDLYQIAARFYDKHLGR